MNEGDVKTADKVGLLTINAIKPTANPLIQALQVISTITGISLLIIHLSFVVYLLAQTQYHYYAILIIPWPICLIACVAKSVEGILAGIMQYIRVGFALTSVGSLLYLALFGNVWNLGYVNTFAWLAIIGGIFHCSIVIILVCAFQHLTPIELEQNYLCKWKFRLFATL